MDKEFKSYFIVVLTAFLITLGTLNFFSFYLVSGDSMAPTLENNNYLIVKKEFFGEKQYQRGDVIVFSADLPNSLHDKDELVKRIIAIPGDVVRIENNHVYVNDSIISENYLTEEKTIGNLERVVEPESYFVLGDNRKISLDSRESSIGLIKENEILGEVIIKMFPFERIGEEIYEH